MSFRYTFRPISVWPCQPTRVRKRSKFRSSHVRTLELLGSELRRMNAVNVVIEAFVDERDIRIDGMLRSDARPSSPGIIISFKGMYGPQRYPCDTFDNWPDNLRAIGMALAALRAVDRYGVTKHGEQYTGWKQLPPPRNNGNEIDLEAAAEFVADHCNNMCSMEVIVSNKDRCAAAITSAIFTLHPDHGGDEKDFQRLIDCKKILESHHKCG